MAWYKGKQRDVRTLAPEDEGYDAALRQVAVTMDDGTEEIVDAAVLEGSGEITPQSRAAKAKEEHVKQNPSRA